MNPSLSDVLTHDVNSEYVEAFLGNRAFCADADLLFHYYYNRRLYVKAAQLQVQLAGRHTSPCTDNEPLDVRIDRLRRAVDLVKKFKVLNTVQT